MTYSTTLSTNGVIIKILKLINFDKSCEGTKKDAESAFKNLRRYPKDPVVRGRYDKLKKTI